MNGVKDTEYTAQASMPDVSEKNDEDSRRPRGGGLLSPVQGCWGVLAGPVQGLLHAGHGAQSMVTASRAMFWLAYLVNLVATSAVTVLATTVHRGKAIGDLSWHIELPMAFVGWSVCFALVAWIELPRIHVSGRVLPSLERTFRVVVSTAARAFVLVVVVPIGLGVMTEIILSLTPTPPGIYDSESTWMWSCAGALVWFAILPGTMRAAQLRPWTIGVEPRCEGCGYDLRFLCHETCCPECGTPITSSLASEQARPGTTWDSRGGAINWFLITVMLLFRPGRLYRTIKLQEPDGASSKFSRWQAPVLGCALSAAMGILAWYQVRIGEGTFDVPGSSPGERASAAIVLFVGVATTIAFWSWVYHRVLGAGVATYWMMRSSLRDSRWAAKVIDYESAFLWWVWIGNICIAEAVSWSPGRFTSLFGRPAYDLSIPPEVLYAGLAMTLTTLIWGVRYRWARIAVRWSNF